MAKRYPFRISDETVNTYGFRMLTSGGNLSEYIKNPVVLLNHNDYSLPIGKGYDIRKEGGEIWLDIEFDSEHDNEAKQVEGKVERDFMRMASIGTWEPEEISDDPALKLPGQTGPTVTKWTLREVSICSIGSNHNALAMYDKKTKQRISLENASTLIRLFDNSSGIMSHKNKNNMKLTSLLKLSDSASEDAILQSVQSILNLNDQLGKEVTSLKSDKTALTTRLESYEKKEKATQKAEAITLLDAAVKAGLINQDGRASWEEDFDRNHDSAKIRLSSIAPRTPVASQVQTGSKVAGKVELRDMSFQEIVKADRLKELKQDNGLYRQKFYDAHGKYPA